MKVPNPLPLSDAWSPVGYQVVQIAEEQQAASAAAGVNEALAPRSPLGYRLVQVAEEHVPVSPAPPVHAAELPLPYVPDIRRIAEVPRKSLRDLPYLVPSCVAGSVFVFVVLVAIISSVSLASDRDEAVAVRRGGVPDFNGFFGGPGLSEAVIPAGLRDGPARDPIDDAKPAPVLAKEPPIWALEPAKEKCQQCGGERESFGTSVQFVRNPGEAARLANEQHKLTFVLHVSGNFEEARFT